MFLFFDTETTGLPKNWKAPVTDLDNWPRLVQIAWIMCDIKGNRIVAKDYIIKPSDFVIPKDASQIHRITTERALETGIKLFDVLNEFNTLLDEVDYLVAHNINFDEKIIGAEFIRNKMNTTFFKKNKICTMQASTNFCRISGPYGYKWPKLSELHMKLFGVDFEEAHDASSDINATEKCFWEMKKLDLV